MNNIILVPFRGINVRVKDEGQGNAVVLLHGYLESLDIWGDFSAKLAKRHRVISIDLPGHGASGVVAPVHSMELLSEAVDAVLQHLGIARCVLAGHSMGGYVSLACLVAFPERLAGLCLFHSSPFADSEQKKIARKKEIRLIEQGKLPLICNTSIPNGFAEENRQLMASAVEFAKLVARRTPPEGAIAILQGMLARPDRDELLRGNHLPVLFIIGKKDEYVSFESLHAVASGYPHSTVKVLEHSGHSGYLEEPEKSLQYILEFSETVF
jgi:pimeloyl-ACP methyl ester carboxylesterase